MSRDYSELSEEFDVTTGMQQRSVLLLFSVGILNGSVLSLFSQLW